MQANKIVEKHEDRNRKCRLCLKKATLRNSHVIPEFFYKQMDLYDKIHRFNILSTEHGKPFSIAQKGIREMLLCDQCEEKFSKWEGYARRVLYGGECIEITTNEPKGIECKISYVKFKLFQLSILWRAGISGHAAFSSVKLDNHESVLRKLLFEETPGTTEKYGCIILYSTKHTDITSNMIHCMGMSNIDGIPCIRLMLGGCFWLFFLSETSSDLRHSGLFLQETGLLRILKTDKNPGGYIESLAREFYYANPDRCDQLGKKNIHPV